MDILNNDADFTKLLGEDVRFGDLPEGAEYNNYPVCYATTARTVEVSSKAITPEGGNTRGVQQRELEFWVIIMTNDPDPSESQRELYRLTDSARTILERNIQLNDPDPDEDDDGNPVYDPQCATSQVFVQGRNERSRGASVEAMTVRLRCTVFTGDPT